MKKATYKYYIHQPPEYSAGMVGFDDEVSITVDSGDPGGEEGEFAEFMWQVLSDWYDGATVVCVEKAQS